jgi:trypsin-like peptidase
MPRSASVAAFTLILGGLVPAGLGAQTLSTADIAARAAPATVMILTFDAAGDTTGLGSGFIVKSSGVIVTNWHVVAGAARAVVRLSTGEVYDRVDALDGDEDADLAILKIPGFGMPSLTPQATLPPAGSRLVAIGSPLGLSHTVSEGIVSASRLQNGRELLQMTVPISPGSSGGPVLNTSGQVVAVATKYIEKGQQLNFAVPVRYAMGLVEGAATPRPLAAVFGGTGARTLSVAAKGAGVGSRTGTSAAASATDDENDLPDATTSPRESLVGSYRGVLHTRFTKANGMKSEYKDTIQIHISAEDKGVVLVESNERRSKAFVMPVLTSSTTPDGRVVLDMGLAPMNGYQTDRGILAVGEKKRDDGQTVEVALVVERSLPPLTASTGLYRLGAHTTFKGRNGKDVVSTNWQGYAAVVVVRDSAFIDLQLENDDGGSTGGYFVGAIQDGRFRAKSGKKAPNQMDITFHAGRFIGQWTDERDGGARYVGSIEGRRE